MLSTKDIINRELIRKIKMSGFSNIPIYVNDNK